MTGIAVRRPIQGTLYDAKGAVLVEPVDPRVARANAFLNVVRGGHKGARSNDRWSQDWHTTPQSADADSIGDLPTLRARSRDLVRNAPLAGGAISTVVTNAIGTGLTPQPRVGSDYLAEKYGITEDRADTFERGAAQLWGYHSNGRFFDVAGLDTHPQLQAKVLRGVLESGDILILRRTKKDRAGSLFRHCVQLIEADLISNPQTEMDREGFAGGVQTNSDGEPVYFHVANRHEYDLGSWEPLAWTRVPARGPATGEKLVRHLAWRRRPRQSRGIPYLACVIEPLKQLDRYGEAELMAAVVASMFTVFVKSEFGGDMFLGETAVLGSVPTVTPVVGENVPAPKSIRLGTGAIVTLQPGEDIQTASMNRPNAAYDPFVQAKLREIGVAIGVPFENLILHFTSSYSAARASKLEFWKFLSVVRSFIAADLCQPDYEDLLTEAVALGYLDAPGFFEDPLARRAWCDCWWVGPAPGTIDEESEVNAAVTRINNNLSTKEEETAALTGGNYERNVRQRIKEQRIEAEGRVSIDAIGAESGASDDETPDERVDGADEKEKKTGARRTRAEMLDARDLAEVGRA